MKGKAGSVVRFACALLGVMAAGWFLVLHAAKPAAEGLPTDWTHRHVIFSQPATMEQMQRIAQDPRYWQQWYRRKVQRALVITPEEESDFSSRVRRIGTSNTGFWSEDMGTTATTGAGNYPAKYSFRVTSASCTDYVVFNTEATGAANQASIIAYDNVYSGCAASPSVYWAYNTGGQVLTSPAISGDGTQIAFVQTNGTVASLVLLTYAASGGSAGAPAALTTVTNAAYRTCTAPCMTTVPLENSSSVGINDTTSSVFPDYTHDILYVGGASSWLFKISGVFRGNPAEVTSGGFPLQLNTTTPTALTSPIYDFQSDNIFVSDTGGYLYSVSPAGVVTASARLDHGAGIVAAPIVDSTAGLVYAFSSNDNTGTCTGGCAGVYVFKIGTFPTASAEAQIGTGSASGGTPLYEGDFDSVYQNSVNGTGDMYICGSTGTDPILYRVAVANGAVSSSSVVGTLTSAAVPCSPVTDVYNPNGVHGPEEWAFSGVVSNGTPSSCTGGCAISMVDMPWTASTAYAVGQEILVHRGANNLNFINVVITAGTSSGTIVPTWPNAIDAQTTDGTVTWLNQGNPNGATGIVAPSAWTARKAYTIRTRILDGSGNVEIVSKAGTSGTTQPTWPSNAGGTITTDGSVHWINAGAWPVQSLSSAGGVSGIILDNVASSATQAGASQIYFSTLTPQTCTTSGGTGGCAIQASQSGLK